jgi:excisionase family DNA binding protein
MQYMTVAEAAARLRANEQTVRKWLREGKLVGVMPGGTKLGYRIPASEVERLLEGGPVTSGERSSLQAHARRLGLEQLAAGMSDNKQGA